MSSSTFRDRPRGPGIAGPAALVALLLAGPAALAEPVQKDRAAAEVLFNEARDLVKAGSWAEGCPKFEASFALSPAASTMLNIARCHEHDGKIATAWGDYSRALALNGDTEGEERKKGLEELAKQGLAALDPRVPRLRITLIGAPAGAHVLRDGQEIPAAALGTALPADPGSHQVSASAPGFRSETRAVTLEEGKTAEVALTLHAAAEAPAPPPDAGGRSWMAPAGIAFAAIGAVGLGAGAVTGILSLGKVSAVKTSCHGTSCLSTDQAARDDVRTATTLGNVSTAGLIAGGALAAAGVALIVLHHGSAPKPASSALAPSLRATLGPGSIDLRGSF